MSVGTQKPVSAAEPISHPAAEAPAAPAKARRAIGVDVARAVALIGMISVHVFPNAHEDNGQMTLAFSIFGGRAAALFAVLAGVSIAFVEKRSRGQLYGRTLAADRAALVVRGLLILLAGLLLGHLETPIETIIPYFGILFLLAVPFYGRSSRFLLIAVPVFAILGPILVHTFGHNLPEQADPEADYTVITAVTQPVPFIADMLLTGFYPTVLWMAYLCAGIVIGRQVLTSRKVALALLGWGAALAIATWVLSQILLGPAGGMQRLVEATPGLTREDIVDVLTYGPDLLMPNTTWWWLAAVAPYTDTPLNVLHNLGAAMAALGLILLLTRHGGKVFSPFAAIGAMTLTLYSAHCVILTVDVLDVTRPVVSLWVQVISFMLFALMWRASMGKGPLEAIISEASDWVRRRIRTPRDTPPKETTGWLRMKPRAKTAAPTQPSRPPETAPPVPAPAATELPAEVPPSASGTSRLKESLLRPEGTS
jgi:uncharacterized membrane protein